jgi:hypothetical protein
MRVVPSGAVAYKYADPVEGDRWLWDEVEVEAVEREDPSLVEFVVWVSVEVNEGGEWLPVVGYESVGCLLREAGKVLVEAWGVLRERYSVLVEDNVPGFNSASFKAELNSGGPAVRAVDCDGRVISVFLGVQSDG